MSILLSHPTPNNNVRALVHGFLESAMLYEFCTTVALFPDSFLDYISSFGPLTEIRRRRFDPSLKPFIRTYPQIEIGRQLATKAGFLNLVLHEKGPFCVDAVLHHLDYIVSKRLPQAVKQGVTAVYAYEDGALASFITAEHLGIKRIYELPIAYWETSRKLLTDEAIRLPHWALTLGGGTQDSQKKLDRKRRESELADIIVVPSQFVLNSLPIWALKKQLVIAPFGTPTTFQHQLIDRHYSPSNKPLRVLFVGSMGQRKGLGDLFAAVKLLNRPDLELVILGSPLVPVAFYRQQLPNFIYEPGRPNEQVLALMRTCDVFCLPSIVEGRALVMQEAMSQGLPLIITPNTGGADLIKEGSTGFLVPIRSPEMIATKLAWFLANRDQIPVMGKSAQLHAMSYTWNNYSTTIINAIRQS